MLKSGFALILAVLLSLNFLVAQSRPTRTTTVLGANAAAAECLQDATACGKLDSAMDTNNLELEGATPVTSIRLNEGSTPERTKSSGMETMVLPPEQPTEFQTFVEDSLGKRLPLFGYNLFQGVPSTFAPVDRIPVPADYVIGPGDELVIRAWGQIDIDAHVVVDRDGHVYLPRVGSVSVAGVRYEQLSKHVEAAVGRVFRNFNLTVTLGRLRSIQVFVVGYARRPGVYTISSLSTLVNALFASGGPSSRGSMRHIQLKRGNKVVSDFDLYGLLLKGDKTDDVVLLPGDVIYIPPVGPQVAVSGSVNFPAIYELRSTATLGEQLEVAGGVTSVADGQRVIVERIENHTARKVEEFTLDMDGKVRELHDGDLVRVFSISPKFENAVTLRGNVAEPGRYPFREGMRIRDLIPNREFLLTRKFWRNQNEQANMISGAAFVSAESGFSQELSPGDDAAAKRQRDASVISKRRNFDAEWYQPEISNRDLHSSPAMSGQAELRNDVKRNAPDINWDYAVIQRVNPVDLSTVLIPFNIGKAILDGTDADNARLQPGDVITIFSQRDIAVPNAHQSKFVRLEGEFRAPGVYKTQPGETLRSLIARAGGFTDQAFVFGTQFTRESARRQQQASLDQMVRDLELEAQHRVVYSSISRPDQQMNVQSQLDSQRMLIDKLREVKATGRVVLEIGRSDSGLGAFPELELEDGDRVIVPHTPSTIGVVGSVYNQSSFLYQENSSVSDYIKISGGGTRDADMKHMFVIRADGSVLSRTNTSGFWSGGMDSMRVIPGDTIVIPAKLDKGSTLRALKDWSQVVSQFGLGVAAINVLR